MKNKRKHFSRSSVEARLALTKSQELSILSFGIGATCIVAALFVILSFDFVELKFNTGLLVVAGALFLEALLAAAIKLRIKNNLSNKLKLAKSTRLLGLVLIATILTLNIFLFVAGFILLKEKANLEYRIGVYSFLVEIVVMVISALNILRGYVMSTFFMAEGILAVLALFHLSSLWFVSKYVHGSTADKKIIPYAILLILSALSGNILALIQGLIILRKTRNKDSEISVSWIDVVNRLYRSHTAAVGLLFVVVLLSLSIWANYTFDYSIATENNYTIILNAPSMQHLFGTDDYGRDIFSRVIFGAKISLLAGISATLCSAAIGIALGSIAGYSSSKVDNIIMRILDIFMAVPGLLLPIAIITAMGGGIAWIVLALSLGTAPSYARLIRASVLTLKGSEFIEAAVAAGASGKNIVLKHILPNSMAPLIVRGTMGLGGNVLALSSLSFLGVGVQSYIPEWGNILKAGSTYLEMAPWIAIYPGIAIVLLVLSFNLIGDGFRDAMDPKLK